eukprot:TRINITY_DN2833_c0_g1_i3.p2 TRINITY_DN2833_c0_g1~~TRINITY_DN2833_c0_g1_i3.p2  ORF type:complete len:169 (-),score=14.93 TRINITY_DN2833_c0_g1_i3:213-719(-)
MLRKIRIKDAGEIKVIQKVHIQDNKLLRVMGKLKQVDLEDRCKHPSIEDESKQVFSEATKPSSRKIRIKDAGEIKVIQKVHKQKDGTISIEGQTSAKQYLSPLGSINDKKSVNEVFQEKLGQRKLVWSSHWGWTYDVWPDGMEVLPSHHKRFSIFWHSSQIFNRFSQK